MPLLHQPLQLLLLPHSIPYHKIIRLLVLPPPLQLLLLLPLPHNNNILMVALQQVAHNHIHQIHQVAHLVLDNQLVVIQMDQVVVSIRPAINHIIHLYIIRMLIHIIIHIIHM